MEEKVLKIKKKKFQISNTLIDIIFKSVIPNGFYVNSDSLSSIVSALYHFNIKLQSIIDKNPD